MILYHILAFQIFAEDDTVTINVQHLYQSKKLFDPRSISSKPNQGRHSL